MNHRTRLVPIHRLKIKCPVCGKRDNCAVSEDRAVAFCRRVESGRPGRGGWTHLLSDTRAPLPPPKPRPNEAEPAPIEHRDAIYCALLAGQLTLSAGHRERLRARGLSDAEITRLNYKSTPAAGLDDIAAALSVYGLEGVPGFYRERGRWRMSPSPSGVLIPARNSRGQIQALQIRADGGARYRWLSSRDREQGCTSGAPVHVANYHLLADASEVLITEGVLKADVIGYFTRRPVIGVAGVGNFGPGFAPTLKARAPRASSIIVAYDRDLLTNPNVYRALETLTGELRAERFRVRWRTWPGEAKGFDDYLLEQSRGAEVLAA